MSVECFTLVVSVESWKLVELETWFESDIDSTIKIDSNIRVESILRIDLTPWIDSTLRIDLTDLLIWSIQLNVFVHSFELRNSWSAAGLSVCIYVEVVQYVNLSCWSKFLWPTLRSDSLFAPTRIYVEILLYIKSFYRHLGIYFLLVPTLILLGRKIQMGLPFGDSPLLLLVPRNYFCSASCWKFPVGASELIPFGARLDCFCYLRSPEITSQGFLLVITHWGLP